MPPSRLPQERAAVPPRLGYVALGIFVFFWLVSQLQIPLSQFQTSGGVDIFHTPTVLLRAPQSETGRDYLYADQDLNDDALPQQFSDEARDTRPLVGLTPLAVKKMEEYQYHNSRHRLDVEEYDCHERTNRASEDDMSEIIDNGEWCPELHRRKFLVVDWVDFCSEETNQHSAGKSGINVLQELVRNIAWAIVTQRTILFREMGVEAEDKFQSALGSDDLSCDGEDCAKQYDVSGCNGRARLDPWVPMYSVWKKEYGWDDSIIQVVKDPSQLEYDSSTEETLILSAKVVQLEKPPPLSVNKLSSSASIANAEILLEFDALHGMILDETILFKEAQLEELESSVDSFDDNTRTRRYAVQKTAAETSECSLVFEQPCVIYQIGPVAIESSACTIEVATAETDLSSYKAVMEILAMAGNAIDGVVLDSNLPVGEFLIDFLRYRGRIERRNFHLEGCWGEKNRHIN